jgi:hypothetical protein
MFCLSVVISYFNALRSRLGPYKAHAPLVVNADTVLTCPITGQCFQVIAWRRFQVTKLRSIVQHLEFSLRYALNVSEPPGAFPFEKRSSVGAPE